MTTKTKTMKSLARSLGKALKAKGHVVPHSVLLHVLAASSGKSNWHVLSAKKTERTVSANVRGALMTCVDMLQECLRYADNDTPETIDSVLISAKRALEESTDGPVPSARLIEAAKLVIARWEKGDLAEAVRMLDRALANLGKEPVPADSVFQNLLKAAEEVLEANGGWPPDWMKTEAIALEEAITAARNFTPDPHAGKPDDIWASDETFPVEDWRYEVENDDTRLGYWDWVASQREQAEFERERDEDEQSTEVTTCSCNVDPLTGKNLGVNPHCRDHGEHRCECANCGAIWDINELNDIKRYWERVDEDDEETPDGECPDCGSLCYLLEEQTKGRPTAKKEFGYDDLVRAAQAVVDDYDDTGCENQGVISESCYTRLVEVVEHLKEVDPGNALRQAAASVVSDYEDAGCEGCGTITSTTLEALKRELEKAPKLNI